MMFMKRHNIIAWACLLFCLTSQTVGSTESRLSNAEKMVVNFYQDVFIRKLDIQQSAEKYIHPDYIQHNPFVPDGRDGMVKALTAFLKKRAKTKRTIIKQVFSDGDYVILHVHSEDTATPEPGHAGVDIFRVENGKIMEHWDVWQKIPETMPHDNGMF